MPVAPVKISYVNPISKWYNDNTLDKIFVKLTKKGSK